MEAAAPPILVQLGNWVRVSGEIGAHHPQIAAQMQKVEQESREALMILAKEMTQGQQGQGLPTKPESQPTGQGTVPPHNNPPQEY